MKSQKFQVVIALIIVALAFSACGPSEEELAATTAVTSSMATPTPETPPTTAAAQTAAAASPTSSPPTPTCTPILYQELSQILEFNTEAGLQYVDSEDFNGNGFMDIVITRMIFRSPQTFALDILLNDGDGNLILRTSDIFTGEIPQVQHPREIVFADFNGDGVTDIFISDHGQDGDPWPGYQNTLVLSAPGGRLTDATGNLPQQSDFTHSSAAADIDADGDMDLFIGNIYGQTRTPPQIWVNDGSGKFLIAEGRIPPEQTNLDLNKYTSSIFVDVNNDTFPDLILGADNSSPNSAVLLNDGNGFFTLLPDAFPVKALSPRSIVLDIVTVDIDGDGFQDLMMNFTAGYVGRYIQILINNGDGTFRDETETRLTQPQIGDEWMHRILLADINKDSHLDIVTQINGMDARFLPIFLNNGNGYYSPVEIAHHILDSRLFIFIDIDNDGGLDILSSVTTWEGDPEQHFLIRDLGC